MFAVGVVAWFIYGMHIIINSVLHKWRIYMLHYPVESQSMCLLNHRLYRLRNWDSTRRYFTRAINVVQNGVEPP